MTTWSVGVGHWRLILKRNDCMFVIPMPMRTYGDDSRTEYHAAVIHLCKEHIGEMHSVRIWPPWKRLATRSPA